MRGVFRRFKPRNKSDSDLPGQSKKEKRSWLSFLSRFGTRDNHDTSSSNLEGKNAGLNASVHVSNKGNKYDITGSTVYFQYGSKFNRYSGQHTLHGVIQCLSRSHHAEYNMVNNTNRGPCTPQTRTTVLEELVDWCNSDKISLYWMDGMAGTGKTTIVYTLCEMLAEADLLGASFFCSRSLPDCRDSKIIIPTIAFQLAKKYASFAEALAEVLLKDEDIIHRKLDVQLCELLIKPWNARKLELPSHPVIVVDAVDECDEGHSIFLRAITDYAGRLPFKMMITSRPEPSIRSVLLAKDSQTLKTFILHEVEASLVEGDITRYVESQLKECLPSVPRADALQLSGQCGKFFIYAATVCRFIMEADGDQFERFQSLLSLTPSDARNKAIQPIDILYTEILRQVFSSKRLRSEIDGTRLVLHTIICAREPLTRGAIGELLGLSVDEVESRLKSLRSLIFVPQDIDLPLSTFHASLPDFMMDISRSGEFHCHPYVSNSNVLERCLVLMKSDLHHNTSHQNRQPQDDATNSDIIHIRTSPALQYACVFWSEHWIHCDCSKSQMDISSIRSFLSTGIVLYWVEWLSFVGKLPVSIHSLEMLQDTLNGSPDLVKLVHELVQCISCFCDEIKSAPMFVYSAMLTWAPSQSPLQYHYESLRKYTPQVLCGLSMTWPRLGRAITIHSDTVTSIAISRNGRYIISGSEDNTARIWNVDSHGEECVLKGSYDSVRCVAICGDGSHAVIGSCDSTAIWDVARQKAILTLTSNSWVSALAMTIDGKRIAAGHWGGLVCIWDATNGQLVHTLREHKKDVQSVSFTPDGTWLISGSDDGMACVWNAKTKKTGCILRGHTKSLRFVACSPDSSKIATGSLDTTARLWGISGKELHVFRGHSSGVKYVAFVSDGKRIISSSGDGALRIWDVISGDVIRIFTGLAERANTVVAFPNGLKIVSSSGNTISTWNLRGGDIIGGEEKNTEVPAPNMEAKLMAFSANGRRVLLLPSLRTLDTATLEEKIVLGSNDAKYRRGALSASGSKVAGSGNIDGVIEVWKLTGDDVMAHHIILQGHTGEVKSLSFSHDERQFVSTSNDFSARVWDVSTGKQIRVLRHPQWAHSATFSHDDTQIVSATAFVVRVWNIQSGKLLHQFDLNAHSIAFSPDDHHIITFYGNTISISNAKSFILEHTHRGYEYWTTLEDDTSYALSEDGQWICYSPHFGVKPRQLLWIPPQYRPHINNPNDPNDLSINGPLFTRTSSGVQVCLPRKDGLVTLVIPHDAIP